MAETIEEIIIIEEGDAAEFETVEEQLSTNKKVDHKKTIIIALVAICVIVLLLMLILFSSSTERSNTESLSGISEKLEDRKAPPMEQSKVENLIAKANYLYSSGSKEEALLLYEQIAQYSESLSQYNLGVAQLKNQQYALALKTFQKAINNNENRCVSAINAAVCSLHLEDKEAFRYYIDMAYAYLPNEINSPLYSYYYALISYYNHNYLEALSALKNRKSDFYAREQDIMASKIHAMFDSNYDALEAMESSLTSIDAFSMGLLYARVGDLTLAIKYFEDALIKNIEPIRSHMALALVNLKAGKVYTASKQIKDVTDMFPDEVYQFYPIKATLKESLFHPEGAQLRYRNITNKGKSLLYQKIFYFSPYKVFDAEQTISYIRKGNANIFIDNIDSAQEYLKKSASSSSVNKGIAQAIKKALSFKIREANEDLLELVKIQPKHSILHYNIGLTYAQLGDMPEAHSHFLKSYHLDAKNYISGIYAVMTAQITNKEHTKMKSILKSSLEMEPEDENIYLFKTLMQLSENNIMATSDWLSKDYKQRPLYLALDSIISLQLNHYDIAQKAAQKLIVMQPNDIMPHILYIDATFHDLSSIEYAKNVHNYLKDIKFHFTDLYFGPYITQYSYIHQMMFTGRLYFVREQLKSVLATTPEYTHDITSALAMASFYDKAFEESYTLYNQLIDTLKVRDTNTLFLASAASIAAKHPENAIALLELSKMKDPHFLETRYALGLLYLEVKNNQGAAIQFTKIGDSGFSSEYFNFDIDLQSLYTAKLQKKK
ncbi:MAG: tetratricopeptide repeat protein [Sulfurimonadaceae bacterium]|jgi:tetratricopeptide (TPR) repeat protein|nr:tetratricopeptide repeat protein [Sulfurimonadaceae bacterium]